MIIKNLTQLKRAIEARTPFEILEHNVHPESVGQIRVPNVVQTNGFYSVVRDEPNNPINFYNNHRGSWLGYGKAREDWEFNGETVTVLRTRFEEKPDGIMWCKIPIAEKVMIIKFLDEGDKESV